MRLWQRERVPLYGLVFGIVAAALVSDRLAKLAALTWLEGQPPVAFLADTVVLVFARNEGAFLGMGGQWPEPLKWAVLLVLPFLLCVYGLWWCWARESDRTRLVGITCLVAGGLGNLFDRAFLGFQVVDFLNFGVGPLRTGIVNVADLFVTAGALVLAWQGLRARPKNGA